MANKGVLSKNYYIDSVVVADFGANIYNMMAEADQAMAEASEIIAEIASLTERVPSHIRCNELLEACASAQAEIKSVDFLSYGQKVDQGLQNLLDHNQYITEHFIKNMETHTEKMRGLGEEFKRLSELITYSGESMPLKGIAFSPVSNAERVNIGDNARECVSVREKLLWEVAARLSEVSMDASGKPIVTSADEKKATEYYKYLKGLTTLDKEELLREVAAKLSGTRLDAYGKPIVTSADEAGKANVYYWYLDKYASASISEIAAEIDRAFGTINYTDAEDLVQIAILNSFEYNWMKSPYVTYDFLNKVIQIADKLGASPDDLMTIMAFESGFNPQCVNSSGASGLIQFTTISLEQIKNVHHITYTKADILAMDALEQLDVVYLHCHGSKDLSSLSDLYMSVFWPNAIGKEDDYVLFTSADYQYSLNSGADVNGDGKVTKGEATQVIIDYRNNNYQY